MELDHAGVSIIPSITVPARKSPAQIKAHEGRIDIKTLAKATGYSVGTVSMALNDDPRIKSSTRAKIRKAADESGYVPNIIAQLISSRHSRAIGILAPISLPTHFAPIIHGIIHEFESVNQPAFVTYSLDQPANEDYYLDIFSQLKIRGLIIAPCPETKCLPKLLRFQQDGTQVLLLDRALPGIESDFIGFDNQDAAKITVSSLIDAGHKRIAIVLAETSYTAVDERLAGYRAALRQHKVKFDPQLTVTMGYDRPPFTQSAHLENVRRFTQLFHREHPTAVVLAMDGCMVACMEAAQTLSIRVPEDCNLVTFADVPQQPMGKEIIRVVQPAMQLGHEAARMLLNRIAHPSQPPKSTLLPCQIHPGDFLLQKPAWPLPPPRGY